MDQAIKKKMGTVQSPSNGTSKTVTSSSEGLKRLFPKKRGLNKKVFFASILGLLIFGGGMFILNEMNYYERHVETDDAHIDADISPVISRIGGFVDTIRFEENERVSKGDTLLILDGRDYLAKLDQAEASLSSAESMIDVSEANLMSAEASIGAALADVDVAKMRITKTGSDFEKAESLLKSGAVNQQQIEVIKAEKDAATAFLSSSSARLRAAQKQADAQRDNVKASLSAINVKKADIEFAKLQLTYSTITAPVSGIVSRKTIQSGELVQTGQALFSIVNDASTYVTANFKETQLERMHRGQSVDVQVDAFPDTEFRGVISSFSPATGSAFQLLPADNATGNYVKVVQRVPVKIVFNGNATMRRVLKPGMNARVVVTLDH